MKRLARWWLALTSRRERGTTLALFRAAVGMVILVTLLEVMARNVIDVLWIDAAFGGMRPIASRFVVLDWLGGPQPTTVWAVTIAGAVLAAAMTVGAGGRPVILLAAIAYRTVSSVGAGSGGYDAMIANACWLIFLADSTATLSVDCRLKHGTWTREALVPAWPRYLAIGQLVLIYTATGLQKTSASWTFADDYSALYWFLQDPTWVRFDMGWTGWGYRITQLMTFAVWHFEVLAPLLLVALFFRDTPGRPGRVRRLFNRVDLRKPWVAFGIAMHLGIALLMNMGPFSWISLAFYICLLHPDELTTTPPRDTISAC